MECIPLGDVIVHFCPQTFPCSGTELVLGSGLLLDNAASRSSLLTPEATLIVTSSITSVTAEEGYLHICAPDLLLIMSHFFVFYLHLPETALCAFGAF